MEQQAPRLRIYAESRRAAHTCVPRLLFPLLLAPLLLLPWASHTSPANAQPPPTAQVYLSEVQPNPQAVPDSGGEWIELFNGGAEAVNLLGWQVRVRSGYSATLPYDTWLAPGGYAVLAELPGVLENGGVIAHGLLPGLVLDDVDTLELYSPDGQRVESAAWGVDPPVLPGRSLERLNFGGTPMWAAAWQPWSGSAGDWGSPGAAYTPPPPPTATPQPPPRRITEMLAAPAAVADEEGEWLELYNPNDFAIALAGWTLTNAQNSVQTLGAVEIPAHGYLVLGRSSDASINGGVSVQTLLDVHLANEGGSLALRAAGGALVDYVTWGVTLAGRSLERMDDDTWRNAVRPWPGSAGDWGSPGAPPPPAPPTPTATPLPPTPAPLAAAWPRPGAGAAASPIQIDEVAYRGSDDEYVVLVNASDQRVGLAGWQLGDAAHPGDAEALAWLPEGAQIPAGGAYVVARTGAGFAARWHIAPDAQFEPGDPSVSTLVRNELLARGNFALDDGGDEVVLLNPDGLLADALCYGDGDCAALGMAGRLDAPEGISLQRVPGPDFTRAPDVRDRWALLPAAPLQPFPWPQPAAHTPVALPGGLLAWWGVLDAASTWSPEGVLPPRALLAAAAAQGLDFVALSDPAPHAPLADAPVTLLPAWGWQAEGDSAIIFAPNRPAADTWPAGLADRNALLPWLQQQAVPVLWRKGELPAVATIPALAAHPTNALGSAADAATLVAGWRTAGGPLLPAGSGLPLPFAVAQAQPRYTGLAATSATPDALIDAIAARRGWMSTEPGLWVVLTAADDGIWMGGTVAPANSLQITARASDRTGAPLHVVLWQDGVAVAAADVHAGASWSQPLPAPPDTYFYATATRADGAFAVSAPIHVTQPSPESALNDVRIVEVLPRPAHDWNGDGALDADDEYIKLANRGAQPVALAGWQLVDSHTADEALSRFTFDDAHIIPGQGALLLWRSETHIVLNDGSDHLYLFLPGGGLADEVSWRDAETDLLFVRPDEAIQLAPLQAAESAEASVVAAAQPQAVTPQTASEVGASEAGAPAISTASAIGAAPQTAAIAAPSARAGVVDVEAARARGIFVDATVRGVVILPPGLLHSTLYIAQEGGPDATCGTGLRVFLPTGDFPPIAPGDLVTAHGRLTTFRGERELLLDAPTAIALVGAGVLPQPIVTQPAAIGEALEGRLVTFSGRVAGVDGDSLYLDDPAHPDAPIVRVMVARSLGWPRPAALPGQYWRVTGVVSQMARAAPWNGGYRVLVRWPADLEMLTP